MAEFSSHVQQQLQDTDAWRRWQSLDQRLVPFTSLAAVVKAWRDSTDEPVRDGLAALTALGSARGGDDQLAAMTALVLMTGGVCRMAHDLRDIAEPEDVAVAMWLEIRRAEPSVGPSVARHLVKRARQRLVRESRTAGQSSLRVVPIEHGDAFRDGADLVESGPFFEFVELLTWAARRGVMSESDVALLAELVDEERAGASRTEALTTVGARRGLAVRTVRHHRQLALAALRRAVPDYLAATA